eukprot:2470466-Amphidinium_carterae.1
MKEKENAASATNMTLQSCKHSVEALETVIVPMVLVVSPFPLWQGDVHIRMRKFHPLAHTARSAHDL